MLHVSNDSFSVIVDERYLWKICCFNVMCCNIFTDSHLTYRVSSSSVVTLDIKLVKCFTEEETCTDKNFFHVTPTLRKLLAGKLCV